MTTDPKQEALEAEGYCASRTKSGKWCRREAGWGTDHPGSGRCKLHGGSSPNGKKHASRQVARQAVEQYGLPVEVDPHTALIEELHRTAGHVAWLGARVQEQQHLTQHVGGGQGGMPEEKQGVWLAMYKEERKHLTDVAATCIKAGIEERRVRIAEQQGQIMAQVIQGILVELGVANNPGTPKIVRKHLMQLEATAMSERSGNGAG